MKSANRFLSRLTRTNCAPSRDAVITAYEAAYKATGQWFHGSDENIAQQWEQYGRAATQAYVQAYERKANLKPAFSFHN